MIYYNFTSHKFEPKAMISNMLSIRIFGLDLSTMEDQFKVAFEPSIVFFENICILITLILEILNITYNMSLALHSLLSWISWLSTYLCNNLSFYQLVNKIIKRDKREREGRPNINWQWKCTCESWILKAEVGWETNGKRQYTT